jgi:hypothetical protein
MPADVRTFMERVMAGEILNPERVILDEIDAWNRSVVFMTLPYYLGMSTDEYRLWVENRASIFQLVERRRA